MKKGLLLQITPLVLLAGFAACKTATKPLIAAHPNQIQYPEFRFVPPKPQDYRDTLANGIPVYVVEDRRLPALSVTATVRAGSIYDPDSLRGIGGITASLMRTGGTESYTGDEFDARTEFLAAEIGCSMAGTMATASLEILKKDFDEGLRLFAQMLRSPRFDANKLELEKKRVLDAIAHRWDSPQTVSQIAFSRLMYGSFPAGRLATVQTVKAMKQQAAKDCYARFFHPPNLILTVSGDMDRKEMLAKLNQAFGDWKSGPAAPPIPKWEEPMPEGKLFFVERPANQAFIAMGLRAIQRPSADEYPLIVLNHILGGGSFTSRLMGRVRSDEGLVYDVRSDMESNYFYPGLFSITLQTKSASAAYASALCVQELKRLRDTLATTEELDAAKRSLIESFPSLFRTGEDIAASFRLNEYWGRPFDHFERYPARIKALTLEDLNSAAQKYLDPGKLTTVMVGDLAAARAGDGEHPQKLSDLGDLQIVKVEDLIK